MSNVSETPQTDWLKKLDQNPQPMLLAASAVVVVLAATTIILRAGFKYEVGPEVFGALVFAGATLAGVLWYAYGDRTSFRAGESARLLLLIIGGSLGFSLALASLCRAVVWREYLFGGLETWQGKEGWRLWLLTLECVAACVIMFASLLLARTQEQSNALLRRLLYGYNAVLTGFILLVVLTVVNLLVYNYIPNVSDYTNNKIYTLNPKSQQILKGLKKPVTVVALVDSLDGRLTKELQNLDDNCRRVSDQIRFEYVVRDRNRAAVQKLVEKYKIVSDLGLLVIYGGEDAPSTSTQFIKLDEIFSASGSPDSMDFKGEDLLLSAIDYLDQDKAKPVLYFTQANGELEINSAPRTVAENRRATLLRQRLEKANYVVKGLRLSALKDQSGDAAGDVTSERVPDDATAVVIASPTRRFSEDTLKALEAYMNPTDPKKKRGKLIVLFDVDVVKPEGVMRETGLESFLQSFSVQVGADRILSIEDEPPNKVTATGNRELRDTNPVTAALATLAIPMLDVRTVQPHEAMPGRPGGGAYHAEIMMVAFPSLGSVIWAESDLGRDPQAIVKEIQDDPKKAGARQFTQGTLPISVAVSEAGAPDPRNPHAFMQPTAGAPRLAVFGNALFVSDAFQRGRLGRGAPGYPYYDIFESTLAWLRERPQSIGLDPKDRKIYQMDPDTNLKRLEFLPLGLMTIAILGIGLGVWVVRRR